MPCAFLRIIQFGGNEISRLLLQNSSINFSWHISFSNSAGSCSSVAPARVSVTSLEESSTVSLSSSSQPDNRRLPVFRSKNDSMVSVCTLSVSAKARLIFLNKKMRQRVTYKKDMSSMNRNLIYHFLEGLLLCHPADVSLTHLYCYKAAAFLHPKLKMVP